MMTRLEEKRKIKLEELKSSFEELLTNFGLTSMEYMELTAEFQKMYQDYIVEDRLPKEKEWIM